MSTSLPVSIGHPATNALEAVNITSLEDLSRLSEKELSGLHGIGPKAFGILKKCRAEKLLADIQKVADARIRPMMGEYILYVDEKVIGQINHSQLFIKITSFGEVYANNLIKESPYDGAKQAFVIPQDKIDDLDWLKNFISGTVSEL